MERFERAVQNIWPVKYWDKLYRCVVDYCERRWIDLTKKIIAGLLMVVLLITVVGCSSSDNGAASDRDAAENGSGTEVTFNYITAEELKTKIEANEPMTIVDLQKPEDFDAKHIKGAVGTGAFPMDTEEKKALAAGLVDQLASNSDPVILVCPRGKGTAEAAFKLYAEKGIDQSRLFILEGGMTGWPYDELVESK